jgi:hypothetical protein
MLEQDSLVGCTVRDFSPAGVGLLVPIAIVLPIEFDLTFNHAAQHCITVWRQPERTGLKFKSPEWLTAPDWNSGTTFTGSEHDSAIPRYCPGEARRAPGAVTGSFAAVVVGGYALAHLIAFAL